MKTASITHPKNFAGDGLDLVASLKSRYSVDDQRVYIGGLADCRVAR